MYNINRYSREGFGVGLERPIKIKGALKGEEVSAEEGRKKRGKLLHIIKPSSSRVVPRCSHALECGGCVWQELDYSVQLQEKEQIVKNAFAPLNTLVHPIIPCSTPWEYRNKMEFSFSQDSKGNRFLGLILSGSKGHVFNIEECHLGSSWYHRVLKKVREWWADSSLSAYHRFKDEGSLRTLTLRQSARTSDKMAMLTVSGNPAFALTRTQIEQFSQAIRSLTDTVSLFLQIHQISKGSPTQFYEIHLHGKDHLQEKLQITPEIQLTCKISPTAFFQPNTLQAEKLYARALEMLQEPSFPLILDLYCGTATQSLAFSTRAQRIIGIELNPHAVFDAQENIAVNHIKNIEILQGDVGKILPQLPPSPDLVLIDPPRSGLDQKALEALIAIQPKKILYISCNPYTQAENIKALLEKGFHLLELQPIDQFPHTIHVENIALLTR
jgi:23S rRNA (uracil1939-C5)-methyltransferase